MRSPASVFKPLIAFIGLIAVLLGALEHEDLILQNALTVSPDSITNAAMDCGLNDDSAEELLADSGTEGTFRAESYRFWIAPLTEIRREHLGQIASVHALALRERSDRRANLQPRQVRVMALRL